MQQCFPPRKENIILGLWPVHLQCAEKNDKKKKPTNSLQYFIYYPQKNHQKGLQKVFEDFEKNKDLIQKIKEDFLQLINSLTQDNDDIFAYIKTFTTDLESIINQEDGGSLELNSLQVNKLSSSEFAKRVGCLFDVKSYTSQFANRISHVERELHKQVELRNKHLDENQGKLNEFSDILQRLKHLTASRNDETSPTENQLVKQQSSSSISKENQSREVIRESELIKTIEEGSLSNLFNLIASGAHLDFESIHKFPIDLDFVTKNYALEKFQLFQAFGLDVASFAKRTGLLSEAASLSYKLNSEHKLKVKQFFIFLNQKTCTAGISEIEEKKKIQENSQTAGPKSQKGQGLAMEIKNTSLSTLKHWIDSGIRLDYDSIERFSADLDFIVREGNGLEKLKLFQANGLDIGKFVTRTGILADVESLNQGWRTMGITTSQRRLLMYFKDFVEEQVGSKSQQGGISQSTDNKSFQHSSAQHVAPSTLSPGNERDLVTTIKKCRLNKFEVFIRSRITDLPMIKRLEIDQEFIFNQQGLEKLKLIKETVKGLNIADFVRRTGILSDFTSMFGENCELIQVKKNKTKLKIHAFHSFLVNECGLTGCK